MRSDTPSPLPKSPLVVVGAGLAGCEAAWQAAERGVDVTLIEMKPEQRSPAHVSPDFAELVCSNSLRASGLGNAVGLLKEEMRRLGSLVLRAADETAVPAGRALAVDRIAFSRAITDAVASHPRVSVETAVVEEVPAAEHGDPRHRAAHRRRPGARPPAPPRRRVPLLLRRHLSHRVRRLDRSRRSPSGPRATKTGEGDYLNLALDRDQYETLRRRPAGGGAGAAPCLRGVALLRGLPPHRGDGATGTRDPGLRTAQAGGSRRSADRAATPRGGPAAAGRQAGRALQPGGLPDQAARGRAAPHPAQPARARGGGLRAFRLRPPQHLRQRAAASRRPICSCAPDRGCGWRARWRASKATWSRRPWGCWRGSSRPPRCGASRRRCPRKRPPTARCCTICRPRRRRTSSP